MPEITPDEGARIGERLKAEVAEKRRTSLVAARAALEAKREHQALTVQTAAAVDAGDVESWRESFQRGYLAMLCEPAVLEAVRKTLLARDPKAVKDVLGTLLPALVPQERGQSTPTKVTFVSSVPRSGQQPAVAVQVER
jgi:hypothetical protein